MSLSLNFVLCPCFKNYFFLREAGLQFVYIFFFLQQQSHSVVQAGLRPSPTSAAQVLGSWAWATMPG